MRRLGDLIARDADRLAESRPGTPASCCARCAGSCGEHPEVVYEQYAMFMFVAARLRLVLLDPA